jgi:dihydroorotate dehydrogenase (fumarate)
MFNRFYLPDLDLETLDIEPRISLSSQSELRLPLRWIGIVRDYLAISLAGSTGVHTGRDVAKLLLAGADVAMTTSALLHHGAQRVGGMLDELRGWMREHHYDSVDEMRGAVSREASADPTAYERASYIGNITAYTSRFIGASPIALKRS